MHYHVHGGMKGYLPNYSVKFDTLGEAQENFNSMVEEEFDLFNLPDYKVRYNEELDYVDIDGGGNEYYEIVPCDDENCSSDDDME